MPNSNATLEICAIDSRADTIFGYGVNCITGGVVVGANCVENIVKLPPQQRNQDNLNVKVVKNSSDFSDFLNAGGTVSVSGLSWSATASVAYASANASTDTSLSYMALRDVRSSDVYLDITQATITADALTLLAGPNGPANFVNKYGTHCVIGVSYGGSFAGYIRLDTTSATHKESISASMSASATGFGVKGSVNADFSNGLNSITTTYDLTSNSSLVGATPGGGFSRTDPDGMLNAAQAIVLNDSGIPNVKGAAVAFICVTWDQFSQIQQKLNDIGRPNALSLSSALGVLGQLSAEYGALNYVIGTCQAMIDSGDFAIPAQRGLAGRLITAAVAGQQAIQAQSFSQIQTMDAATLQSLQISSRLNGHVQALSHNSLLINVDWYTDAAFAAWGDHKVTLTVPINTMPRVISVDHVKDWGGSANLYLHVGQDPQGYYLTTTWDWPNDQHFDSSRVDIGGNDINSAVARAEWSGANWNNISANLINYP